MAKQAKLLNYRHLTYITLKEKYALILLGLATFSAILITVSYGIYIFAGHYITAKQTVHKKTKTTVKAISIFPKTYIVKEGDVLGAISVKMYGTDAYVDDIMKANNLYTQNNLPVGTKITIPAITPRVSISPGQIDTGLMTGQVQVTSDTYTVQPGETLSDIALKVYGDNNAWVKIAQVNNIADPNNVEQGTVLKIPKN